MKTIKTELILAKFKRANNIRYNLPTDMLDRRIKVLEAALNKSGDAAAHDQL